jgi:hypothetical protein
MSQTVRSLNSGFCHSVFRCFTVIVAYEAIIQELPSSILTFIINIKIKIDTKFVIIKRTKT